MITTKFYNLIKKLKYYKKLRFLLVGGFNTCFGYFNSIVFYYFLKDYLGIILISLLFNITNIIVAYSNLRFFVFFDTTRSYFTGLFRAFIVFANIIFISTLLLWFFVDKLKLYFPLAAFITTSLSVILSYISHEKITFK